MGNCLSGRSGDQMINVMRMDGKILEYSHPLLVRDLLKEEEYGKNYSVADPQNFGDVLPQDYKLKGGEFYYLIPSHLEVESSFNGGMKEKKVEMAASCASPVKREKGVKVKILVSKTELKALLSDGCVKEKWVEDFVMKRLETKFLHLQHKHKACNGRGRWRPALENIPETHSEMR